VNSDEVKRFIVDNGTCRPNGAFPKDITQGNRSFSTSYYTSCTKAGLSIPVTWLAYSPILDAAYCKPCWLFAYRNDPHYHPAWSTGIRNWRELSQKIKLHATSSVHVQSCVVYEQWKKHGTITYFTAELMRKEKSFWCEVLKRFIKITLMLAENCQSFRGHVEKIEDTTVTFCRPSSCWLNSIQSCKSC